MTTNTNLKLKVDKADKKEKMVDVTKKVAKAMSKEMPKGKKC